MKEIDYVPLSAGIADVYRVIDENAVDTSNIEEWAAYAASKMQTSGTYEPAVSFVPLSNHKAKLPKGLKYIWQVAYKPTFDETDVQEIRVFTSCVDCTTITTEAIRFYNSDYLLNSRWRPMRSAVSPFVRAILCANAPENSDTDLDMYYKCEHEYDVTKTGILISRTLSEGTICVGYLRYPTDENGEFLIPNDADFIEGIRYYCMARIWEVRAQTNVREFSMFEKYLSLFEIKAAKVRGMLQMPGIDQLENLKQSFMQIAPTRSAYYSFFGNLAVGNDIAF